MSSSATLAQIRFVFFPTASRYCLLLVVEIRKQLSYRLRVWQTLHLMVGLPCSGKSTLAKKLEHELPALRLTTDEWHIRLFGQDAEDPEHDARHSVIEDQLWSIASRALALGTNVILDFGFWAREEREDYRTRAKQLGASSEIHYLDVPPDELLKRLAKRNSQPSQEDVHHFPGSDEALDCVVPKADVR